MEIFLVLLIVFVLFLWMSLSKANKQIERLKSQHKETHNRLKKIEIKLLFDQLDDTPEFEYSDKQSDERQTQICSSQAQTQAQNQTPARKVFEHTQTKFAKEVTGSQSLANSTVYNKSKDVKKTTDRDMVKQSKGNADVLEQENSKNTEKTSQHQSIDNYEKQKTHQSSIPSLFDESIAHAKRWLITGNVPVKIGMLLLFPAVIALLRYVTAQGWLHVSMEHRLIGISLSAVGALIFAWTKRETKRSFSLSVQGGSIGILLLVIFSAVKMYGFMTPTIGFILSILAVLLASALALKQDAKALIVMAIFAGFLAPIWLSENTGSHVTLFTYYAILNLGIFIVSWVKPWRELNLLGFVFTYVIGSIWGGLKYTPEHFATIEPFVILFFGFYLLIPLRGAQRAENSDVNYDKKVSASLLFGAPLVTLGLQVGLLHDNSVWLAWSCVAMGVIYGLLAWILRGRDAYDTLHQAYIGLAAVFITIAVPIGLSAKATSAIFALEGAGAMWLGCRARRTLAWLSGALLQLISAIGFFLTYYDYSHHYSERVFLFNEWYLSALLIITGSGACVWACYRQIKLGLAETNSPINAWLNMSSLRVATNVFFLWGMTWWLVATANQLSRMPDVFLFTTITAGLLVVVYRYFSEPVVVRVQSALIHFGAVLAVLIFFDSIAGIGMSFSGLYPFSVWDCTVWGAFALIGWGIWRAMRNVEGASIDGAVITWVLSLAMVISIEINHTLPSGWNEFGFYWWAVSSAWLALATVGIVKPHWLDLIAKRPNKDWQVILTHIAIFAVGLLLMWVMKLSGGNTIWWLPIVNSLDALVVFMSMLILKVIWNKSDEVKTLFLYIISVLIISSVTLRMLHHWDGFSVWQARSTGNWNDWWQLATFGFWLLVFWVIRQLDRIVKPELESKSNWREIMFSFGKVMSQCIGVLLVGAWLVLLFDKGNISPLPWIPVLNPLAILQLSILIFVWLELNDYDKKFKIPYLSIASPILGLILISVMTLRFVHHWGGVAWSLDMLQFSLTQMALTLVWSVLGAITWITGSRRESRVLWFMGAIMMGMVIVKLFLFDRDHLNDFFGIVSFLAPALLFIVVGYFAPIPPIKHEEPVD